MAKKKLTKKEAILEYLQENAVELRKQIPTLVDAQYENETLVLTVLGKAIAAPLLTHKGVELDVVVETTDEEPMPTEGLTEAAKRVSEIRNRPGVVTVDKLYVPTATPAVGPDGNGQRRNQDSYTNWKKRFNK